jgi:hypothetical protein
MGMVMFLPAEARRQYMKIYMVLDDGTLATSAFQS